MGIKDHDCPQDDLLLYADGELQGKERDEIKRHLSGCPVCQEFLVLLNKLKKEMKNLPISDAEPCPSPQLLWW